MAARGTAVSTFGVLAQAVGLLLVALSGALVAFFSQASSPDYRALWWMTFPFAVGHLLVAIGYVRLVPNQSRWVAAIVAAIATFLFVKFTLRIWT